MALNKILIRVIKVIVAVVVGIPAICILLMYACERWWPESNGSYSLGNNIYMLDWDGGGRIIVRGSSIEGNTCYGGEQLIPTNENQYDSLGNIVEYVVDAVSDENWIIAKTENKVTLQRKYYILDKRKISDEMTTEEIIKKRIKVFADSIEFARNCSNTKINIQWR